MSTLALFHAPHRAFFLTGSLGLVCSMAWWLIQLRSPAALLVPAGWLHGWLMVHAVFAPFVFGFLFTAMPRWTGAPMPADRAWQTLWWLHLLGLVCVVAGSYLDLAAFAAGWGLVCLAWSVAVVVALRLRLLGPDPALHAVPAIVALVLGGASAAAIVAWTATGDWRWSFLAMRLGFWGFLFTIYVTVCHRMIPFFANRVLPGYRMIRPAWALVALLLLGVVHLVLDLRHAYHLLWWCDLPMALIALWLAVRWQTWRRPGNRLLSSLFIAWWVLVAGLALLAAQSLVLAVSGQFLLGRGPQHLIAVGFFGGMLVAMATRVSLGHSGRPLTMGRFTWYCFWGFQGAALARLAAEIPTLAGLAGPLLQASALLWLVAATGWAAHYLPLYWRPRADGRPG